MYLGDCPGSVSHTPLDVGIPPQLLPLVCEFLCSLSPGPLQLLCSQGCCLLGASLQHKL